MKITLTAVADQTGEPAVALKPQDLIAYDQQSGFTRLWLRGRKQLDVEESTDEIDRQVRAAASSISNWSA
jgi:hypothetical protein